MVSTMSSVVRRGRPNIALRRISRYKVPNHDRVRRVWYNRRVRQLLYIATSIVVALQVRVLELARIESLLLLILGGEHPFGPRLVQIIEAHRVSGCVRVTTVSLQLHLGMDAVLTPSVALIPVAI